MKKYGGQPAASLRALAPTWRRISCLFRRRNYSGRGSVLLNQLEKPDPSDGPMPVNRDFADTQRVGDLPMRESDEVAHLCDVRVHGIFPGQGIQRFIHQEEFPVFDRGGDS